MELSSVAQPQKQAASTGEVEKVVILGAGPAGLSAALYAARAELSPLVLTGLSIGGQVALTHTIENYPGYPEGVGGLKLGELFQQQAERFGARYIFDNAESVEFSTKPFVVRTYDRTMLAETVIIATGASPNLLGVPGEKETTGQGTSYCATCDGWFFKEKDIIVVGGGDSALEEAIFLTRFARSVTIIHRRDALRAGAILQTRARENPKIGFIWDSVVTEIVGGKGVEGVRIRNVRTSEESYFKTDGVFVFIGHSPNTQMFAGKLAMNEHGFILTNQRMQTSIPGVFAAGEVMDNRYKQVVTSAGMGAAAAIEVTRYLEDAK